MLAGSSPASGITLMGGLQMDDIKRLQAKKIGHGGLHCPCCHDRKDKVRIKRYGRRKMKEDYKCLK